MKFLYHCCFIFLGVLLPFIFACNSNSQISGKAQKEKIETYQCIPCGNDCDNTTYSKEGTCPDCGMQLVKASSITFKTLQPEGICAFIKTHPNAILLDVRTREEFEGKANPDYGTLKNAINIPIQELDKKMKAISALKDKEILVYCSHSHRSPRASYLLTQNGFTNIMNLAGGMSVIRDTSCKK